MLYNAFKYCLPGTMDRCNCEYVTLDVSYKHSEYASSVLAYDSSIVVAKSHFSSS